MLDEHNATHKLSWLELTAWAVLVAFLMGIKLAPNWQPNIGNDGFHYIRGAESALHGAPGRTSLVYYDAERRQGSMPAAMVTHPPGYSLAIAATSLMGVGVKSAALAVSMAACSLSVALMGILCRQLAFGILVARIALALYVSNSLVLSLGVRVLSESLFILLVLSALVCLLAATPEAETGSSRRQWWFATLAGLGFGLSYCVRYAGLFLVAGLYVSGSMLWVQRHRRAAGMRWLAAAVASAFVVLGCARNILITGTWKGGNDKPLARAAVSIGKEMLVGLGDLLFGHRNLCPSIGLRVVAMIAIGVLCLRLSIEPWRYDRQWNVLPTRLRLARVDCVALISAYSTGVFLAGVSSPVSVVDRMLVPLLPLMLLLGQIAAQGYFAAWLPSSERVRRVHGSVAALAVFCYLTLNLLTFSRSSVADSSRPIAALLDQKDENGQTARAVLERLTGKNGLVVANVQSIAGTWDGPIVVMAGQRQSTCVWTEPETHALVRHFRPTAFVTIAQPHAGLSDDDEPQFARLLAQGESPAWLRLVYRVEALRIYEPI